MIDEGLNKAIENIPPIEFTLNSQKVKVVITGANLSKPEIPFGTIGVRNQFIYPTECRQRNASYKGKLTIDLDWYIDGQHQTSFQKEMGEIPIMIKV